MVFAAHFLLPQKCLLFLSKHGVELLFREESTRYTVHSLMKVLKAQRVATDRNIYSLKF